MAMCELLHTSNHHYFYGNNKGPLSEILQMIPKPASLFAFARPACKTDARCRPLPAPRVTRTPGRGSDLLIAISESRKPRQNSARYPVNAGVNNAVGRYGYHIQKYPITVPVFDL